MCLGSLPHISTWDMVWPQAFGLYSCSSVSSCFDCFYMWLGSIVFNQSTFWVLWNQLLWLRQSRSCGHVCWFWTVSLIVASKIGIGLVLFRSFVASIMGVCCVFFPNFSCYFHFYLGLQFSNAKVPRGCCLYIHLSPCDWHQTSLIS